MAFPFVNLALLLAASGSHGLHAFSHWFAIDIVWKIASEAVLGAAIGAALGWLTFHVPSEKGLARTGDGFVALGLAALAYGLVQLVGGYGFVGVFAAAVAMRSSHRESAYHERMHDFSEELERLLMMVVLVFFGAALVGGGLLNGLTWPVLACSFLALLVVRPLSGWLGTMGSGRAVGERAVLSASLASGVSGRFTIWLTHCVAQISKQATFSGQRRR